MHENEVKQRLNIMHAFGCGLAPPYKMNRSRMHMFIANLQTAAPRRTWKLPALEKRMAVHRMQLTNCMLVSCCVRKPAFRKPNVRSMLCTAVHREPCSLSAARHCSHAAPFESST